MGLRVRKTDLRSQSMLCFVVGDGFDELVQKSVEFAYFRTSYPPSPALSPTSFEIARFYVWYSISLAKSPCE